MLTVIPGGKTTAQLKFNLNSDLEGVRYKKRTVMKPHVIKTEEGIQVLSIPSHIEVLGIDPDNHGFERLSFNATFKVGKKKVGFMRFMQLMGQKKKARKA